MPLGEEEAPGRVGVAEFSGDPLVLQLPVRLDVDLVVGAGVGVGRDVEAACGVGRVSAHHEAPAGGRTGLEDDDGAAGAQRPARRGVEDAAGDGGPVGDGLRTLEGPVAGGEGEAQREGDEGPRDLHGSQLTACRLAAKREPAGRAGQRRR